MLFRSVGLYPSIEGYIELEKKSALAIFTLRHKGKLIGYSFFLVYPHLHRQQITVAVNDLFFITHSHRKGWLASKFIKYFEPILFANGISQIMMRTKSRSSFAPLLKRCGYAEEEISYIKKKE